MTDVRGAPGLRGLTTDEAAARVREQLDMAAAGDPAQASAHDAAAVDVLRGVRQVDDVLEAVPIDLMAGLLDRCVRRLEAAGDAPPLDERAFTWEVLDLVRRPAVLRHLGAVRGAWADRLLRAVEASHLTVGPLFRQRAAAYESKILFELPSTGGPTSLTWGTVSERVERIACGLLALDAEDEVAPIAILSENRLEMALLDLACLTSGIPNVMVPANATERDVGYILGHAQVRTVVVSTTDQWHKVRQNLEALPVLRRVIAFQPIERQGADVLQLKDVEALAPTVDPSVVTDRSNRVRVDDRATVMYTSGTTGTPKGIQFSHRNLVFKRFARALALPELGERDVFLCYLPLFHTFGRFLELLGCVFWGAKYCFLLNPSVDALVRSMRRYRPTVFISVPRKWIQLYEAVAQRADPLHAPDAELLEVTRDLTGGRLKWGLSAAGHLDADIFRFFHRQGIQLLSGFGMSEATGGITMTPPGEYRDNSLGIALPGIELKLDTDGELMIRGGYVMMGYLDPPDGEPGFEPGGWLRSGDLMEMSQDGHLRLVDRKKEIYKNVKGQTIAPQRIENHFREFESVGRAFLVGDHREYNTLLLYPNPEYGELDFSSMSPEEVREHFRSLVVSVNKFVAPFERVVDFAIIDRDLDADCGELTPKGTPRRKVVEEHFADVIEALYRRATLTVDGVEITVPNWLLQVLGVTTHDITAGEHGIRLPPLDTSLTVRRLEDGDIQVGAARYRRPPESGPLNLGALLATPRLWLGNEELVAFAPLDLATRHRPGRVHEGLQWRGRVTPYTPHPDDLSVLDDAVHRTEWDLMDVDRAARLLASDNETGALAAVRLLELIVSVEEDPLADPARHVLGRGADVPSPTVRRRAFQTLVPVERDDRFRHTVERFLARDRHLVDDDTSAYLCDRGLPETKLKVFAEFAQRACLTGAAGSSDDQLTAALLRFLAEYGAGHPVAFRRTRAFLVRMSLFCHSRELRTRAAAARSTLDEGFRQFLGPSSRIAVDTETRLEYRWEDVVVFEDDTAEDHRRRLLAAIKQTTFLREALFLFYRGAMIRLHDIPPGGVWIRLLGRRHDKAVYRITVQTRAQETYEVAANLVEGLDRERVEEEIDWLILCGEATSREPVVEDFGGYYPEQALWSEEYISGETLDRELRRLARRETGEDGLKQLWPFLSWSALSAYVDFWVRTGARCEIADPSPADIVLPTHDYHRGSRIVSLSARKPHEGLLRMLRSFKEAFIDPVERAYPVLTDGVGWDVVFSSVLEVVGEQEGLEAFERALAEEDAPAALDRALRRYIAGVRRRGFLPMRLYFAAKRYRRWEQLNRDATAQARARMLQELSDTYGLDRLARTYPEVRLRFFRETVLRDSPPELARGLDEVVDRMRRGELRNGDLAGAVADIRHRMQVDAEVDYFLARIPFAYLRPEDAVDFVSTETGGSYQSEFVVTLEDMDGNPFRVRHALTPKEVERLHRLYLAAQLDVRFRPEHRFLVAINDREQIIGGIYYDMEEQGSRAHLEKIVVADRYRRKGVADGLMYEFFNRLRASGVKHVTTGFFRPEYFYGYGFTIERRYAGLVKALVPEEEEAAAPA